MEDKIYSTLKKDIKHIQKFLSDFSVKGGGLFNNEKIQEIKKSFFLK